MESGIEELFDTVYEGSADTIEAYCIRCDQLLERKSGEINPENATRILDRNLGQTTLTEVARKIFENRPMNKR